MEAKVYTEDDVIEKDGKLQLEYVHPSTGSTHTLTGEIGEAIILVKHANKVIAMDLQRKEILEPYKASVAYLCNLVLKQSGSGARTAAQALLSTYNGVIYQLSATDLCNLDKENFDHVITLLKGRYLTSEEPHNLIENGNNVFDEIADRWSHLHVDKRYSEHYDG